jgi:hypothetical protein
MTRSGDEMMSDMRSVTLRMPDDVAEWVEQTARRERRSLNSQIVILLEAAQAEAQRKAAEQRETKPDDR